MTFEVESGDRAMVLAHYYRAMVGRADVWRMRMDTTTNWAIGATAAIVSFTLGNDQAPHFVVFIATLLTLGFLQLEARRLTFYHLWQQRVLLLEQGLVRPALAAGQTGDGAAALPPGAETDAGGLARALDAHLGQTVPSMPRGKAVARRLRRIYLYLFGVQLLAWVLKLASHPEPSSELAVLVHRAHLGIVPGGAVIGVIALLLLIGLVLAYRVGGVDRDPA